MGTLVDLVGAMGVLETVGEDKNVLLAPLVGSTDVAQCGLHPIWVAHLFGSSGLAPSDLHHTWVAPMVGSSGNCNFSVQMGRGKVDAM